MVGKVYKVGGCCGYARISLCDNHLGKLRNPELDFPQPHQPVECQECQYLSQSQTAQGSKSPQGKDK